MVGEVLDLAVGDVGEGAGGGGDWIGDAATEI